MLSARYMTIILAVSMLAPSWAQAEENTSAEKPTYTLRYKFEKGDVIAYQIKSIDRNKAEKALFSESTQNRSEYRNHVKVIEIQEDGSAVLETQIDHAVMEAKFNDDPPILFDSSDPNKQPAKFRDVKESIGKPTARATISPSGELKTIQSLRPDPRHPNRPIEPAKKDASQNFLIRLPDEQISVGNSWSEDYQLTIDGGGLPMILKMRRTFTLTKVENQIATINMKTAVLSPINSPEIEARIIQQTPNCVIDFDMEIGQITQRNWKVDKVVIGGFGPDTSLKVVCLRQDTLIPASSSDTTQSTAKID